MCKFSAWLLCLLHATSPGHLRNIKIGYSFSIINDVLCGCILNGICWNMSSTLKFMFFIIIFIIWNKPGLALQSHSAKRISSLTRMSAYLVSITCKVKSDFSFVFVFLKKNGELNRMIPMDMPNWMGKSSQGLSST